MCRICDVGLVEDPASVGDEGDVYFRDHHDVDPSFPAGHVFLVEVGGEEEFEAVRSVLIDAGIPFVVQGTTAAPHDAGVSGVFAVHTPARIAVPREYMGQARDVLEARIFRPVSELRVKALETRLFSDIIWSAVWFAAGFGIACLVVPGDWDQGLRFLVYAVAGLVAVPVGNAALRPGRGAKEKHPWLNE
ncbi:MAG TPA: hypothetical protein PKN85_03915 [Syntrophorhabdaceae bacterium]|nr:hypothetical protein [Syntrophorhabdaceae bacterium]HOD76049.1 hypothetical protein [Syntrophorhabdaceae bacterium]